jgi:hypothetical protein
MTAVTINKNKMSFDAVMKIGVQGAKGKSSSSR